MNIGARVIRGQGWKWADQDSGEGGLGTLVAISVGTQDFKAVVQWDHSNNSNATYSYSLTQEPRELRIYDNATCGVIEPDINCDSCEKRPVSGFRWKCIECESYDLCTECYMSDKHSEEGHDFMRRVLGGSTFERMPNRKDARKVALKGVVVGAKVQRGCDWDWKEQNGNSDAKGTVEEIVDYTSPIGKNRPRSFALVSWPNGKKNTYRMAFRGKVDLLAVEQPQTPTQYVYIEHLPSLGGEIFFPSWEYALKEGAGISKGTNVTVPRTLPKLRAQQQKDGLWNEKQTTLIGRILPLASVGDDSVQLECEGETHKLGKNTVQKVDSFNSGQVVQPVSDPRLIQRLQQGHGGVNQKMIKKMGSELKVVCLDQDGDVLCMMGEDKALWNRLCLRATKQKTEEGGAEELIAAAFLQLLRERNANT